MPAKSTSKPAAASDLIRNAGFRTTAGRVRILDVLMQAVQPLSHADVEACLASDGPGVDRVTVYRVLDSLVSGGLVQKAVDTRGVFRYSSVGVGREHLSHVHFRCVDCGGVFCLDAPPPPPPKLPRGFRLRDIEFDVRGTCPRCSPVTRFRVIVPLRAWLLAIALLLLQHGAFAHGLEHDEDAATPAHACATCLAFASAASGLPSTLAPVVISHGAPAAPVLAVPPAPTFSVVAAYRSRAPPAL